MEYTVLARRFRPQSFGEVIGQEMIAQALRNAITAQRVAHAYLFTGARGVGKTSTARILAKSLNCPASKGGDPCNQCEVCQGISVGSDVDVIEIDGASNRGIDEIRTLRANVNVKPMRCRYKIYIIDEVHMLTKEAFNALLKTLEEPPANVKFIFCTTDPQKVPETILSRCQRFDFGTIAAATIGKRLTEIAAAEGVEVEPKAVALVARRAAGSMRDSQSLFDQLLAFGGQQITAADVHRLLGTAPDDRLVEMGDALLNRDRARVLDLLEQGLQSGVQIGELTDQLLAYFRDLMVLASGAGEALLLSVDDEQRAALSKQATAGGLQTILAALQILAESKNRMKGATFSRVLLELALVRIATLDDLDSVAELVAQFRQSKGVASPSPSSLARTTTPSTGTATAGRAIQSAAEPAPSRKDAPRSDERVSISTRLDVGHTHEGPVMGMEIAARGGERVGATVAATKVQITAQAVVAPPAEPAIQIPFETGRESEIWSQTLTMLPDMSRTNARNVCRTAISGPNILVLTFPKSYHFSKQYFERSPEQLGRIEKALERVVGQPIRVSLAVDESLSESPAQTTGTPGQSGQQVVDPGSDPLVQRAVSVFGATVIRVESATARG